MASIREAMSGPYALITVGEPTKSETFVLPKMLLCKASTYFQAALNNGFEETHTQKITFDDEDTEVFRTFVTWLYQDELNQETLEQYLKSTVDMQLHLIMLGIFAEKRGIKKLHNDVLTMLSSLLEKQGRVRNRNIKKTIPIIPTTSQLLALLVNDYIFHVRYHNVGLAELESLPRPYLARLFQSLLATGRGKRKHPFHTICENYHHHDSEGEKEACQRSIKKGENVYKFAMNGSA